MRITGRLVGLMVYPAVILMLASCLRNDYEILDPATAGTWTLYTTADGLPSDQVSDIQTDSQGNLWVSFPGYGAAKFDNNSWTYFRAAASPLLNDGVNCVAETADGRIVFGTLDGLSILASGNVWSSYVDPTDGMDVTVIKVASNGWIWVGTRENGFYLNTGTGFTKNLIAGYSNIRSIEEGPGGAIYIGTDNGIVRYYQGNYTYIKKPDGLPDDNVRAVRFDSKERLWIGTEAGKNVVWIDRRGIHQLNLIGSSDSVRIRDIHEDRRGRIWFATHRNGVSVYDGVIARPVTEIPFPENRINCIGQDKSGNLWFGLYSKGLLKYTLPLY